MRKTFVAPIWESEEASTFERKEREKFDIIYIFLFTKLIFFVFWSFIISEKNPRISGLHTINISL
jgi:hypothetical protein